MQKLSCLAYGTLASLKPVSGQLAKYFFLLCLPTLAVILYFLSLAPIPSDLRGWLYWLGIPSYYFFIIFLAVFLSSPVALIPQLKLLIPIAGGLWLVLLAADIIVFNSYKFHINLFFVQMFFLDFKGLGLPGFLMLYAGISALLLIFLSFGFWWLSSQLEWLKPWMSFTAIGILILSFSINQSIHAWASYFYRSEITRYSAYLPFYFPVQDPGGALRLTSFFPNLFPSDDAQAQMVDSNEKKLIRYPLAQSTCHAEKLQNIVIVVIESWQADTLNMRVMPHTAQLASSAWRFNKHLSGGNATIPGIFSLMTGLHASYYDAFRTQALQNRSFFTESLHEKGYESRVFTNSSFNNFGLKPLLFSRVSEQNYFSGIGPSVEEGDQAILQAWSNSFDESGGKPRFDFLFFASSHYPYSYPDSHKKFTPVSNNKSEHLLRRDIDPLPLKNDYFNSLNYIDSLLSVLISKLSHSSDWENTWLVVVGDHGEEFNENGLKYWGHASNFSRWQTHVPLIIKPANHFESRQFNEYSTHQDIVPTLLTYVLGCRPEDISKYANGQLLDHLSAKRSTVIGSYVSSAYWVNADVQDKLFGNLNYDWSDMQIKRPDISRREILDLMDQEARFFMH
jgi:membrane-anchored protein YejM (alkaline phosphatase superfamily)